MRHCYLLTLWRTKKMCAIAILTPLIPTSTLTRNPNPHTLLPHDPISPRPPARFRRPPPPPQHPTPHPLPPHYPLPPPPPPRSRPPPRLAARLWRPSPLWWTPSPSLPISLSPSLPLSHRAPPPHRARLRRLPRLR